MAHSVSYLDLSWSDSWWHYPSCLWPALRYHTIDYHGRGAVWRSGCPPQSSTSSCWCLGPGGCASAHGTACQCVQASFWQPESSFWRLMTLQSVWGFHPPPWSMCPWRSDCNCLARASACGTWSQTCRPVACWFCSMSSTQICWRSQAAWHPTQKGKVTTMFKTEPCVRLTSCSDQLILYFGFFLRLCWVLLFLVVNDWGSCIAQISILPKLACSEPTLSSLSESMASERVSWDASWSLDTFYTLLDGVSVLQKACHFSTLSLKLSLIEQSAYSWRSGEEASFESFLGAKLWLFELSKLKAGVTAAFE